MEQLLAMLKDEPYDSFLNYALALEYAKAGDLHQAINLIEAVLKRDENYLGAYYQLGKQYEMIGNMEQAVSVYTRGIVIARKQNNRKAVNELNEALQQLED